MLFVLGAPASGVEELASFLVLAGFQVGREGGAVASAVDRLVDHVFASEGATGDRPDLLFKAAEADADPHSQIVGRHVDAATRALRDTFVGAEEPMLAHPATPFLLPLWVEAARQGGWRPEVALVHRDPGALAAELERTQGLAVERAMNLWRLAHREVFRHAGPLAAVIDRDVLADNPVAELRRVLRRLGREPLDETQVAAVRAGASRVEAGAVAVPAGPLPADVRQMREVLQHWRGLEPAERRARVRALDQPMTREIEKGRHADLAATVPKARPVPRGELWRFRAPGPGERLLIFHFHFFKNAGTSFDAILKANFDSAWTEREFTAGPGNRAEAAAFLSARPELAAFSSHTARLPPPELEGRAVLPVLFVRHPIDRLRSAYEFERKQKAETFGAKLAKVTDFRGYVQALLDSPQRQAKNFHASRLSAMLPAKLGDERARAFEGLRALPFVGLVESFDASMERLAEIVRLWVPAFRVVKAHKNVTASRANNLEARVRGIRLELGEELYVRLQAENEVDFEIHELVRRKYQA
jgi:hypothetical protein